MITKYLKIYGIQIKNNFVREAVYRTNFLTTIVVDIVWMAVELGLFTVIYANTPTLAGWTKPQVFFFLGVFFSSDAIFTIFFQRNFWMFNDLVNKGDLDTLLTKPVNPLFLALTRWVNLTNIFNLCLGLAVMIRYADDAGFRGGIAGWSLAVLWLAFGVFASLLLRFAFSIWVFWTERAWSISRLYYQMFSVATKPDTIYPAMIRYTILTVLPFGFIGSVPARALLHGLETREYFLLVSVLVVFFLLDWFLWRMGLKRYRSASS